MSPVTWRNQPFRNRDRSNRSGRGQVEHNVLDGLPINQYREAEITIGPGAVESKRVDQEDWKPMPRDSHLLPEHSQQILRAARLGRVYKPPTPPEDDKDGMEEEDEQKEVSQGFTVKKWVKVPRHLEDAEPEYLAKRRKGLPSQYGASGQVSAPSAAPVRETKIKKTDSEGNVSVYKVLVPEGQVVEGEVQATDAVVEVAPVAAAPGTVVEGVGVVNAEGVVVANDILQQTPPRRRPPPPKKRRRHGIGRGRKKVVFAEGVAGQGTPASGAESGRLGIPGLTQEGSVEPSEGGDTPMPDAGDDEEGSGDEGSDDDEREEGTHSPTPAGSVPPSEVPIAPTSVPNGQSAEPPTVQQAPIAGIAAVSELPAPISTEPSIVPAIGTAVPIKPELETKMMKERDPSSSPDLPLSTMAHSRQNSTNHIPTLPTPDRTAPASEAVAEVPRADALASMTEPKPKTQTMQMEQPASVVKRVPTPVSEPPPVPQDYISAEAPASDEEPDLLGSLERQLDKDSEAMRAS